MRLEADPSDFEPPPRPFLKDAGLAFIETHLCRECQRTRDCRTHHAHETNWRRDPPARAKAAKCPCRERRAAGQMSAGSARASQVPDRGIKVLSMYFQHLTARRKAG